MSWLSRSNLLQIISLLGVVSHLQFASALTLTSPAFTDQNPIPALFTCNDKNISPPLMWDAPPPGTQTLVLIMEDPDAPSGVWIHWILFNIPGHERALAQGIKRLPEGTQVGKNSWQKNRYDGPCPPNAMHRYSFKLFAVDIPLNLARGVSRHDLLQAMHGHILASAKLTGIYSNLSPD